MNDRLTELLPWYVNGSLGAEDRAWVERQLAANAESRAELEWYRSLGAKIQGASPDVPPTLGLEQTMARIRAERPNTQKNAQNTAKTPNSFGAFLSGLFASLGLRPAVAFVGLAGLAIFALQGAVIFRLANPPADDASELRAVKATLSKDRPMLKLNFAPDAKEADMRMLLVSVQGRLAGGPGQLGEYYVIVPAGKEEAAAGQLKSSRIVQAVSLAPGLPPRE